MHRYNFQYPTWIIDSAADHQGLSSEIKNRAVWMQQVTIELFSWSWMESISMMVTEVTVCLRNICFHV